MILVESFARSTFCARDEHVSQTQFGFGKARYVDQRLA
jgi:hypothetical protein